MAIAHAEVVTEVAAIQVRAQDEAVLVDLVRVVRDKAYSSRKSVLGDHVAFDQHRLTIDIPN